MENIPHNGVQEPHPRPPIEGRTHTHTQRNMGSQRDTWAFLYGKDQKLADFLGTVVGIKMRQNDAPYSITSHGFGSQGVFFARSMVVGPPLGVYSTTVPKWGPRAVNTRSHIFVVLYESSVINPSVIRTLHMPYTTVVLCRIFMPTTVGKNISKWG